MSQTGLLRSSVVFGAMTLLSRIAGFARDWLQAVLFGVNPAVSAFVVAYRIPNYLRRIFAEGSFASAFVPVLSELRQRGDEAAVQDFLDHVAGALFGAVLMVTALGMLAAPWIARLFLLFADSSSPSIALTAEFLRITFPYLAFISMTALAGGVLNSCKRFALPAFTPVLHNLGVIAAMIGLRQFFDVPETALAIGVLLAGLLQWALLWPALGRIGLRPRLRVKLRHDGVQRVFRLMLPTLFSSSVAQLNLLVGTVFASLLVVEAQSWLFYSDRLVELPLGVAGVAIGTVILPHLSQRYASEDAVGYAQALDWGLRMVVLGGVPAAFGLALLAEPLAVTLFNYGEFTATDARMVGAAIMAMSLGVPAFMLTKVLASAFFSRQDTRTPMRAAIATVLVNVGLTVAFVFPLWKLGFRAAHVGIALATALAGVVNCLLLWRALRREGLFVAQPGWSRWWLRVLVGVALMTPVVLLIDRAAGDWTALAGPLRLAWLLLAVAVGAAAYSLTLLAMGLRMRDLH